MGPSGTETSSQESQNHQAKTHCQADFAEQDHTITTNCFSSTAFRYCKQVDFRESIRQSKV